MGKKPLIDFMIVGAQKAGTTALAHFCNQHPQLSMALPKEAHIFDAPDFNEEIIDEKYKSMFEGVDRSLLLGEATPIYMYWPGTPERLYRYNPNLKLIIILRDPVDRAISHYCMEKNRGAETLPFIAAILIEPLRLLLSIGDKRMDSPLRKYSYLSRCNYKSQIKKIRRYFSSGQVLILDFDELSYEHDKCLRQVFSFLGVSCDVNIPSERIFSTKNKDVSTLSKKILSGLLFFKTKAYGHLVGKI